MAVLEVLIGIAASGKSTYAARRQSQDNNIVIVSSDAIRKEIFGDVEDQKHNGQVFDIMLKRTREALKQDKHVIYDANNLSRRRRINLLKNFPDTVEKIATVFAIGFDTIKKQNATRERQVPEEALIKMYHSFMPPHYDEGFNFISIARSTEEVLRANDLVMFELEIPHDNPHHISSCGQHCMDAYCVAATLDYNTDEPSYDRYIVETAAKYHDMSKYKVKVFDEKGVAHYPNHANVSAYDFLCYEPFFANDDAIEISNLIANHMVFFDKQALKSLYKIYNANFMKKLELLHEADVHAH